jgi:cation diffusion facilitator CzcD-associated flavoprotein CzcO
MHTDVIIIGSGFSGIGAAIRLKKNNYSICVLEREKEVGGTWRDNQYPGIAVDITSFTYSYDFEQNPNWSRVFAPGSELFDYANNCVDKYNIRQYFNFNCNVISASFDEVKKIWAVKLSDERIFSSRFLISATGALTDPKMPDIKGLSTFEGKIIHTAKWDKKYDLSGKNVAVIGTGATSVQLVPAIAPTVAHLKVFQRTPIWIFPKPDSEIPKQLKQLFSILPFAQSSIRKITDIITEQIMVSSVVNYKKYFLAIKALEAFCKLHIQQQVKDKSLIAKLTPQYGFGCKRPSFSSDFYPTFNRTNVELITEKIIEIVPNGIKTIDGKSHKIDTLIAATGFKVMENSNILNYKVFGKGGKELGEFWSNNRLQAYHGSTIPEFPNFFTIVGPYSASGLSWFDMIDIQLNHIIRVLNENRRRNTNGIEIKASEHQKYFEFILEKQKNTVFYNNNCATSNSYYFDKFGDAPFLRPLSVSASRKYSLNSDLEHYNYL